MESKDYYKIEEEASHRLFRWVMNNRPSPWESRRDIREEKNYWIAVVAQEWAKK